MNTSRLFSLFFQGNLVGRITIGLIAGILFALILPTFELILGMNDLSEKIGILGKIFVRSLRSIAPILVFVLVIAAIANKKVDSKSNMKSVIWLYILGTFFAAFTAVVASFIFPTKMTLVTGDSSLTPPGDLSEVLTSLLFNAIDNPITALFNANFIGILVWAVGLGIVLRHASDTTKNVINDFSEGISKIVRFIIIALAPFGVFGLVVEALGDQGNGGFTVLLDYLRLLQVLVGSMLFVALVVNPAIVFFKIRRNPYPLVWTCLRESGVTAFLTRSSAANIPVNLALAKRLKLNEETYSVSIPLGATINMEGAAITIAVLTLSAVYTLGIDISLGTALLLSVVVSLCSAGASGIAGGSLLLIPLACSLFGIPNDIAAQVIGVGFVIGIVQDSAETALNSSTDVVFTAAACIAEEQKV